MSNEVREDAWWRRNPHESATGQLHREAGGQRGVQEKVKWSLFRTVNDYGIQNVV